MLLGLDHFIVAVPNPDGAAAELERTLGLQAGAGGRHVEYGSRNRLIWLGDSYIELLGIDDQALAAQAWFGPWALNVLEQAGAGYVGLGLVSDDLLSDVSALHQQGSLLGEAESGERARSDGRVVRWRVATLPQADAELGHLFLIEHDPASAEWTAEDRTERARQEHPLGGPVRLVRVELPVRDMKATTMRAHRDAGLQFRPSLAGGGGRDASVGRQTLRVLPARSGVLPGVVLRGGSQPRRANLFGCQWVIEPAVG
jgi:hypothetical protein